jgi:hypothetical protein
MLDMSTITPREIAVPMTDTRLDIVALPGPQRRQAVEDRL